MTRSDAETVVDGARESREYWTRRFRQYGHTGDARRLIYAYDQPQRIRAIERALGAARVEINEKTKILDIGCGTGDLIAALQVSGGTFAGIDFSEEVVRFAKRRLAEGPARVRLFVMDIENGAIRRGVFDVVTCVNVLQHVTRPEAFEAAVSTMADVVGEGGHLLVMEFSPIRRPARQPATHLVIRARSEYIKAFEKHGCCLVHEFGLPRIAVRVSQGLLRAARQLARAFQTHKAGATVPARRQHDGGSSRGLDVTGALLLRIVKPFDVLLMPFPARYTDMRVLIFEKLSEARQARSCGGRRAKGRCAS